MMSSGLIDGGSAFGQSTIGNLALSGLSGGIVSHAAGGNFWEGFGTGVTIAGLNHLSHKPSSSGPNNPPKKGDKEGSNIAESDDDGPWVPGPHQCKNFNLKSIAWHGNRFAWSLDGKEGWNKVVKFGEIVFSNIPDIILWNSMMLPPFTPGFESAGGFNNDPFFDDGRQHL